MIDCSLVVVASVHMNNCRHRLKHTIHKKKSNMKEEQEKKKYRSDK